MTATTATDTSGVEYYFTNTAGGGSDSGWQDSPGYEDTGLQPDTTYTYTVMARDKSPNQNATGASSAAPATTASPVDSSPPAPNPLTWQTPPAPTGPTSVSMTATTANDASGVEYYFTSTAGGGSDSGWQDSPGYEDTGLQPDTTYTYTVMARDKSPNQNATGASSAGPATTDVQSQITAVTQLNEWVVDGDYASQGAFFDVSAGTDRLVLVALSGERDQGGPIAVNSVSLGGQVLTEKFDFIVGSAGAYHNVHWLGYLLESEIAAMSGTELIVDYVVAPTNPFDNPKIHYASYQNVDQLTPIADFSSATDTNASSLPLASAITAGDGDRIIGFSVLGQHYDPGVTTAGYTEVTQSIGANNGHASAVYDRPVTTSITENPTFTTSTGTRMAVSAVVLKAANSPPLPPGLTVGPETCAGGNAGDFSCAGIDLRYRVALDTMLGTWGNDVWGWVDTQSGKEYALVGLSNGTAFVDVSDPENPVFLGNLPTETVESIWRDIKVYADHAYIVADDAGAHGMQVFDLTQLRNLPGPQTFSANFVYHDFETAHNLAINEITGFAYAVGTNTCGGGLHIVDINIPNNPLFAGCHSTFEVHDAQCVFYRGPDTDYINSEICFNFAGDRIEIVDVTNKSSPVTIADEVYPDLGFVHQGWLTKNHYFLFVNDEQDELESPGQPTRTHVFDVSDLDAPAFVYAYEAATVAIDHNLYVVGNRVYQANYTAGLRVLEFDNLANEDLVEGAFFDTSPDSDAAEFDGAWSVYPYFPSGTIIVSDAANGLFILSRAKPEVFNKSAEDSLIFLDLGIGDELNFTLDSGSTVQVKVIAKGVDVVTEFTHKQWILWADLEVDGHPYRINYEPFSMKSYYEPVVINGLRMGLDSVGDLPSATGMGGEYIRGRINSAIVRMWFNDAALPLVPDGYLWNDLHQDRTAQQPNGSVNWPKNKDYRYRQDRDTHPSGGDLHSSSKNGSSSSQATMKTSWLGAWPYGPDSIHGGLDIELPVGTNLYGAMGGCVQHGFIDFFDNWHRLYCKRAFDSRYIATVNLHTSDYLGSIGSSFASGEAHGHSGSYQAGIAHTHATLDYDATIVNPWPLIWQGVEDKKEREIFIRADIIPVTSKNTNEIVTFDGRGSQSGEGGNPLTYTWYFDDGSVESGAVVQKAFGAPGLHQAILVVYDGALSEVDEVFFTVGSPNVNKAPKITMGIYADSNSSPAPQLPKVGSGVDLRVKASGLGLSYTWHFQGDTFSNANDITIDNAGRNVAIVVVQDVNGRNRMDYLAVDTWEWPDYSDLSP